VNGRAAEAQRGAAVTGRGGGASAGFQSTIGTANGANANALESRGAACAKLRGSKRGQQAPKSGHKKVTRMAALDGATEPARTRLRRPQRRRWSAKGRPRIVAIAIIKPYSRNSLIYPQELHS
jgi:hypothetical protein